VWEVKNKHYSYTIYTKRHKKTDLTRMIYDTVAKSGFTNGLITIFVPYPTCYLTLLQQQSVSERDVGVSFTLPFFNKKPLLNQSRLALVDKDERSTRRKIHLVVVGE